MCSANLDVNALILASMAAFWVSAYLFDKATPRRRRARAR